MQKNEKHKFSLFYAGLTLKFKIITIENKEIVDRISKILRLTIGESLTLFNKDYFADFEIENIAKNSVLLKSQKIESVKQSKVKIILNIGLLKKEAFEEVLYNATELGVAIIQPIISEKIHKELDFKSYGDRFQKIIISAAEQSKNYNFPILNDPIKFTDCPFATSVPKNKYKTNIFFDVDGQNILTVYDQIKNSSEINLIIGPEADFSLKEKGVIKSSGILICKLTPTILRSVQAANIAAGAIISLFND